MNAVRASIVIPTRNNSALLHDCLASIVADTSVVPREVIVVDNGSTDATASAVAECARSAGIPVRRVFEPRAGSSHARNRGVANATGDIVIFADDDVVVHDGWADALVRALDDQATGLVGGRILPRWPIDPPAWLANGPHNGVLALIDFGDADRYLAAHERPYTANMAVRTSLLRELSSPFEPDLGHQPGRHFGFEDFRLVDNVRREHRIAYAADAVVEHRISAARMTLQWMRGAFFDMGIGGYRSDVHEGIERLGLPRRLVRAWRVSLHTLRTRRANDRCDRVGPETTDELAQYMWAGRHAEMLFERFPAARDLVRRVLV